METAPIFKTVPSVAITEDYIPTGRDHEESVEVNEEEENDMEAILGVDEDFRQVLRIRYSDYDEVKDTKSFPSIRTIGKAFEKLGLRTIGDVIENQLLISEKKFIKAINQEDHQYFYQADTIKRILDAICFEVLEKPEAESIMTMNFETLSSGDMIIDTVFGGDGLTCSYIHDLCGPSGSGKTTLALQFCVQTCLPVEMGGLDGDVVFINTEGNWKDIRLSQIVNAKWKDYLAMEKDGKLGKKTLDSEKDILDRIHVIRGTHDEKKFNQDIYDTLPKLLTYNSNIKLVVIDSIAAVYRGEYSKDYGKRAKQLYSVGLFLKRLATEYGIAILTLNQVSAIIQEENSISSLLQFSDPNPVRPALGLVWSKCVTARVMMKQSEFSRVDGANLYNVNVPLFISKGKKWYINNYESQKSNHEDQKSFPKRTLQCLFHPFANNVKVEWLIDSSGCHGIP